MKMSDLIVPLAVETEKKSDKEKAKQLPDPCGYKILCAVPDFGDTYADSILAKADETKDIEELATVVLFVMKLGPDAYADKAKFPSGPWCKEGDFVVTRAYSGTRYKIHGKEFRMINDDTIEGTIEDPRAISRAI
jgi:co-chaperonin GroES (HSP10)